MKRSLLPALLIAFGVAACTGVVDTHSTDAKPTDVYYNGTVITVDPANPEANAVAVRDGRILAVGSFADVSAQAGGNSRQHDLNGSTLLPGFIDAHGHISFTAFNQASANVSSPPVGQANTVDDVVNLLAQFAAENPDDSWITGWGYDDSLLAERPPPNPA